MSYRVEITPPAQRSLSKLPRSAQERVEIPMRSLGTNPRPPGVKKLQGYRATWRIRVGPFRVIYEIIEERALVLVLHVGRRDEATYRR